MNLENLEKLLHPCVALAFGTGLLVAVVSPHARADAATDWVEYRSGRGLPVDPKPSLPGQMPTAGGPVPDTLLEPLPDTVVRHRHGNGNGKGNGNGDVDEDGLLKVCRFLAELAKSDGDVRGEDVACK